MKKIEDVIVSVSSIGRINDVLDLYDANGFDTISIRETISTGKCPRWLMVLPNNRITMMSEYMADSTQKPKMAYRTFVNNYTPKEKTMIKLTEICVQCKNITETTKVMRIFQSLGYNLKEMDAAVRHTTKDSWILAVASDRNNVFPLNNSTERIMMTTEHFIEKYSPEIIYELEEAPMKYPDEPLAEMGDYAIYCLRDGEFNKLLKFLNSKGYLTHNTCKSRGSILYVSDILMKVYHATDSIIKEYPLKKILYSQFIKAFNKPFNKDDTSGSFGLGNVGEKTDKDDIFNDMMNPLPASEEPKGVGLIIESDEEEIIMCQRGTIPLK